MDASSGRENAWTRGEVPEAERFREAALHGKLPANSLMRATGYVEQTGWALRRMDVIKVVTR